MLVKAKVRYLRAAAKVREMGEVLTDADVGDGKFTVTVTFSEAMNTTANPTLYRAGLAFQALNHHWSRTRVTIVTGVPTPARRNRSSMSGLANATQPFVQSLPRTPSPWISISPPGLAPRGIRP